MATIAGASVARGRAWGLADATMPHATNTTTRIASDAARNSIAYAPAQDPPANSRYSSNGRTTSHTAPSRRDRLPGECMAAIVRGWLRAVRGTGGEFRAGTL